ncbi:hypothetical protein VNI00_011454 [Paramarasmius palmivorus]|uniref:Uncharacterized protein n=1 Tax=Paramarasmius palmivorus TaxID=297713 RepID=A0AAW0CG53_9AGAR
MPAHPANAPFTVEVADSHPQVDVTRRRSRSNAVLQTTMLFRSSHKSATRIQAEGAEKIRIAVTGPEATSYGIPTFTERTSVTLTHRDVNYALRNSLEQHKQSRARQPVRFVTVSPIPDHEVLPPPTTPAVTLASQKARRSRLSQQVSRIQAVEESLLPPDPFAGLVSEDEEEDGGFPLVRKSLPETSAEEVAEEHDVKAKDLRKPAALTIDTKNLSSVSNPPSSTSPSKQSVFERPSAPEPVSPSDDEEDTASTLERPAAPEPGATSSLASSSRLKSTENLPADELGYLDGAALARSRRSSVTSVTSVSSTKKRLPVVKKLFSSAKSIGKRKASVEDADDSKRKGQKTLKRSRDADGEEADENAPPEQEKERRIIAGRNIRRRLLA